MRRTVLVLAAFMIVFTAGLVAGCGGEEEATPTPDTITGTLTTDTTETDRDDRNGYHRNDRYRDGHRAGW